MTRPRILGLASAVLLASLLSGPAVAWNRSPATTFATLPSGATTPEGITVDGAGNVYVTTFGAPTAPPGQLVVFDRNGKFVRDVAVQGASAGLLGVAFHPTTHALLVLDLWNHQVLSVDPANGAANVFATLPATAGPNALTFDGAGNVYISDSFGGAIYRTNSAGQGLATWCSNALLATDGIPPFGANGIAFNRSGTQLLVANTGSDAIVQIPVATANGATCPASPLAFSVNGADGLLVDEQDNIWVAANQSDEIVVLDPSGKVIAKLGDFDGIDKKGAVRGLLFPASLVFDGEFLLVTNLALDLRKVGGPQTIDSQWADQVKQYTVSKINRHLPPLHDD